MAQERWREAGHGKEGGAGLRKDGPGRRRLARVGLGGCLTYLCMSCTATPAKIRGTYLAFEVRAIIARMSLTSLLGGQHARIFVDTVN